MSPRRRDLSEARRLWTAPLALAIATTGGLVAALVGDGIWDAVSWLLLAGVVVFAGWCSLRRREVVPPAFRKP